MRRAISAYLMLFMICAAPALADDLLNLPLEDAARISPLIKADPADKAQGKASINIQTKWPAVVCLGQVDGLDVEDTRLVYQAKVKSRLQGSAYLEMWVEVAGRSYFSRGLNDQAKGDSGWKDIKTEFVLKKGQKVTKVTLNLVINGAGQVWVDAAVLRKLPLQ